MKEAKEKNTSPEPIDQDTQELFEHHKIIADKGQAPLRVDKFLMNFIENTTRNKVQKAAQAGNILVNGNTVKPNHKVKAGDEVKVVLAHPPRIIEVIPENIDVEIIYEDEQLLVVNKQADMVVHPGHGNYSGTLVNALKYHFDNLPTLKAELERPGLVHRIDKGTSGLLVIAKTELAMNYLANQFFKRTTKRLYWALVWGNLEEDEGTIKGYIGRSKKNRKQMAVYENELEGKHAVTHYKVIERFRYVTWVQCKLETGRTHQIRAHFKHIGHPLFNDERYEGNRILKGTTFSKYKQFVENCFKTMPRQGLHAQSLGFVHPTTKEELYFEAPLPNDMETVIDKWRVYINANG